MLLSHELAFKVDIEKMLLKGVIGFMVFPEHKCSYCRTIKYCNTNNMENKWLCPFFINRTFDNSWWVLSKGIFFQLYRNLETSEKLL